MLLEAALCSIAGLNTAVALCGAAVLWDGLSGSPWVGVGSSRYQPAWQKVLRSLAAPTALWRQSRAAGDPACTSVKVPCLHCRVMVTVIFKLIIVELKYPSVLGAS